MHVLMLAIDYPPDVIGGERVYAGTIAPLLRERGVQLELVAPQGAGAAAYDTERGFAVRRIPVAGTNFVTRTLSFAWNSRHAIRQFHGDLVYTLRPVFRPSAPMLTHLHVTRLGPAKAALRTWQPVAALANAPRIGAFLASTGAPRLAALLFCFGGFLWAAALFLDVRGRFFSESPQWMALTVCAVPHGNRELVVKPDKPCSPCFLYPWKATRPKMCCGQNGQPMCITELTIEQVMAKVHSIFPLPPGEGRVRAGAGSASD